MVALAWVAAVPVGGGVEDVVEAEVQPRLAGVDAVVLGVDACEVVELLGGGDFDEGVLGA